MNLLFGSTRISLSPMRPFVVLIIVGLIAGASTGILAFVVHLRINARLPKEQKLSWDNRWGPPIRELCNRYDKLYPGNYITSVLMFTYISAFILGGLILVGYYLETSK
jgi:hypothetical protein